LKIIFKLARVWQEIGMGKISAQVGSARPVYRQKDRLPNKIHKIPKLCLSLMHNIPKMVSFVTVGFHFPE
jgi:hypothetical protein